MAQLFTVYFPKYYFDLQKEFEISLRFPLPFEYVVENGCCYVSMVHYDQDNEGDPYFWQKKGLQAGLRVITINNKSLTDDYNNEFEDDDGHINADNILNEEAMEDLLAIGDTDAFQIQFREEVSPPDYSIPLGLTYCHKQITDIHHQEEKANLTETEHINDSQVGASSFEKGFEPSQCRLNNPRSFWQPSDDDQTTLDTWLRIDLGMKQMVTKLLLQGSPDHLSYVESFWIDYSDDCCQWRSHPLGEIKCKYKRHNNKGLSMQSLHSSPQFQLTEEQNTNNIYATIIIWPAITARFVRIRPYTVCNKVAVRLELFGFKEVMAAANLSFARVVTLYDVTERDKKKLMERVTNLPANTKVIQVDCKAVISAALDRAGLGNVGFLKADRDNFICVFTTLNAEMSERALDELADVGVGSEMGVISTTSLAFRNEPQSAANEPLISAKKKTNGKATFSDSVKSRMIVKQVVERIMNSSEFTFDYICMLVVASLIAAGGLATDNSVIVVASMLVSPLMGPVLAFTFGVTLKEVNMAKLGFKNEILSLVICVICGFIVGFFYSLLSQNVNNWPTEQMSSRGTIGGLADGAFIAAASGVGVALSVLGDYLSTVVGVAISASLLPPAVNCGMLFSFPIYAILYPQWIPNNKRYKNKRELLKMAGWSLLLTIENIIIIFAVSRFMFYVKNVYITKDQHEKVWKSVTNFRQNYNKISSMRGTSAPRTRLQHSTLTEKMRRSVKYAMDYDYFAEYPHTLKGGVLKQRSVTNISTPMSTSRLITLQTANSEGKKQRVESIEKRKIKSINVKSPQSSDSEQSEHSEEDKKPHVAINELFTADAIATIRTPFQRSIGSSNGDNNPYDYEQVMEDAIQLSVINQLGNDRENENDDVVVAIGANSECIMDKSESKLADIDES